MLNPESATPICARSQPEPVQLVGYRSSGNGSSLLVSDAAGEVDHQPLEAGEELAYSLGERHCAGTIDEDGAHVACDRPSAPTASTTRARGSVPAVPAPA